MWHYAHIGETWFYFISPTTENLLKYEQWYMSPDHEQIFFGDLVDHCFKVQIQTGQTLIIPSGWIHAMYTRSDSIFFNSSMMHDLNIGTQIAIQDMERRCGVRNTLPVKKLAWHALDHVKAVLDDVGGKCLASVLQVSCRQMWILTFLLFFLSVCLFCVFHVCRTQHFYHSVPQCVLGTASLCRTGTGENEAGPGPTNQIPSQSRSAATGW